MRAKLPDNEAERLEVLHGYGILDTPPETEYDDLTLLASYICQVPVSAISLIDADRQWFKSTVGVNARETPRDVAFCAHAILEADLLVVPDALSDERFATNPFVQSDPHIRFYAGAPLRTPYGFALGTLCVVDVVPRELTDQQLHALRVLSHQAMRQIELRRSVRALADAVHERRNAEEALLQARDELELRVNQRTQELERANTKLHAEITRRKRAQEDLLTAKDLAEEANIAKSVFLANMNHELRTPLNHIIGYSEMLLEETESQGHMQYHADLKKVHEAGAHLLAIVSDILDLSIIEAGKMEFCITTFEVQDCIKNVASLVEPLADKGENTFEVICAGDLGCMSGDASKLRQCLVSLLDNACKFTRNGTIRIIANREREDDADWFSISVSDTGIGMTREQVRGLFKDFTQLDGSTTRKHGGTGLGLALSRRLCQMMGGDIYIQSEAGKGSTFTIRIPADAALLSSKSP